MAVSPLAITELMYDPAAADSATDYEFIELQNVSSQSLAIGGYQLAEAVTFTFPNVTLAPGERIVVVRDTAAFQSRYGATANIAGEYSNTFANGGEEVILRNNAGVELLSFTYDNNWHSSTAGDGYSLVILNPSGDASLWDQGSSWRPSNIINGTPGRDEGPVDTTPPSTPQGLTANFATDRVNLQWQASSDAESGVTTYRIFRDNVLLGTSSGTSYSDTTEQGNSTYSYRVVAVNAFGLESQSSNTVTVIVPPTGTDPTFAPGKEAGKLTQIELNEISGVVASRLNQDVFWVHNDGAQNKLYAINSTAGLLGTLTLNGVQSTDWEDIAVGPGPVAGTNYLYIADIGDNLSDRGSVTIYRVAEPAIQAQGGSNQNITIAAGQYDVITLRYPGGPIDAESLMVDPLTGDLFILSKEASPSRIFQASAASLVNGANVLMTQAGTINFKEPSAAEISPGGREILVRNEDNARIYQRAEGQSIASALAGTGFSIPIIGPPKEPNGEAITFERSGVGYYTISEDTSDPALFYFKRTSLAPGQEPPPPTSNGTWHNAARPHDVNADNAVTALDVLVLINDINARGSRTLGSRPFGDTAPYLDVNADGEFSPLDVLTVINRINSSSGSALAPQALSESKPASANAAESEIPPDVQARHAALESTADWQAEPAVTMQLVPKSSDSSSVAPLSDNRLGLRRRLASNATDESL